MSEYQSRKMSRKHKQTKIRKLRNKTKKGNVRRKGKSGETKIMIRTVRKEGGWRGSVRGEVGGGSPHRLRFRGRYNGIMGQVINYATCERLRRLKPRYIFLPVLLFVFLLSHRRGKPPTNFPNLSFPIFLRPISTFATLSSTSLPPVFYSSSLSTISSSPSLRLSTKNTRQDILFTKTHTHSQTWPPLICNADSLSI